MRQFDTASARTQLRRGTGVLFGGLTPGGLPLALKTLAAMPPNPRSSISSNCASCRTR